MFLSTVFGFVVRMNITAAIAALFLLPIKRLLQRLGCPKRLTFLLWGVIALRLLSPVLPQKEVRLLTPVTEKSQIVTLVLQPTSSGHTTAQLDAAAAPLSKTGAAFVWRYILPGVWLCGVGTMLLAGLRGYWRLKRRLRFAVRFQSETDVFLQEEIDSSFVFGFLQPRIYMPSQTEPKAHSYMLLHETMHIRRRDHLTKLLAYALLCIHWMNPLSWLLYRLFTDDIELCCDEAVLSQLGSNHKTDYAEALFYSMLHANGYRVVLGQLGFDSNIMKRRIQNVIQYHTVSRRRCGLTLCLCLLLAVLFSTNITAAAIQKSRPAIQQPVAADPINQNAQSTTDATAGGEATQPQPKNESPTAEQTAAPSANQAPEAINPIPSEQPSVQAAPIQETRTGTYNSAQSRDMICSETLVSGMGGIYIRLDMNMQCLTQITVCEADTQHEIIADELLTGDAGYLIQDLQPGKAYSVTIQAKIGQDWQLEGSYTIQSANHIQTHIEKTNY